MHNRAICNCTCGLGVRTELFALVLVDLSEGEGKAVGAVHQTALDAVCLAVRDVMLPAIACWASHDQ